MRKKFFNAVSSYGGSLSGAFLFVIGINIFIMPHSLYSGTMTGVAQIIESLLVTYTPINPPEGYNLTGTALLILNIPLLIVVLRVTDKSFPIKSIINIVFMTTSMSFVPVPATPIIEDILTSCIVGGVLAGFGAGFTLRCGGSGGGTDLIGVYCSAKYQDFSVGKVSLIIGSVVYTYCMIRYDFKTVVYSSIFTIIYAFTLDQIHYQNIKTSAFIFTTNPDAIDRVVNQFGRGATCWEGKGAYSGQHTHVFITVTTRYEVGQLRRIVHSVDPRAFIIFNNKVDVSGNFLKKF